MKKMLFIPMAQHGDARQLAAYLEAEGFCVDHTNGEATTWLEEVKTHQPDVILMEVDAQDYISRYQFCHQLRQDPATETIPIVLLGKTPNAQQSLHYLLEGLHAGANDYVKAPVEMAELTAKIHAAFRLKAVLAKSQVLANQLNSVNEELYQRNIQIEKEMHVARQLQQSLLPVPIKLPADLDADEPMFTKIHYWDDKLRVSGIYLPCDALGGDLYDVIKLPDNKVGINISDVSGHGLPAGFITAIFKTSLYRFAHEVGSPDQVLHHINNELYGIVKTGDYVTSLYLRLDLNTLQLECAGAGHPYPMYYNAANQTITRLTQNGTPLVWMKDMPYPLEVVQLSPGDKIFLFTDGISELKNPLHEMYGEDRIVDVLLQAIANKDPYITDTVIGLLSDFTEGTPLEDDISMVLIEAL